MSRQVSKMSGIVPQFDRATFDANNKLGEEEDAAGATEDPFDMKSLDLSQQSADDELSSLMSEKQGDGPKKSQFFHRLKRPEKPYKRAHYVPLNGRVALAEAIIRGGAEPDLNYVMKLGMHLLLAHFDHDSFRVGALLLEWAYARGVDFTLKEQRTLAKAHHQVFLAQGLYGEQYNLRRSRELFLDLLQKAETEKNGFVVTEDVALLVRQELSALCNSSGDAQILADVSAKVIAQITRTADKGIAFYHLLRGSAFKELGDYDAAANCFFDALNSTKLPGSINRLEMLFIITRNLNQLEAERANRDGRKYKEDYQMIYLQMVQDKAVAKEVGYDAWLHDFSTWNSLAQKLRLLELNALAADLFGQGLIHDHTVYGIHNIWWILAKIYFRCGRIPDARSSIAQAMSMSTQRHQYLTAGRTWWQDPNGFEETIYMWPAWEIVNSIAPQSTFFYPAQVKLKSLLKIAKQRAKEALMRAAEEERIRLREEAKQKLLDSGQQVRGDGRKRLVRDRNKLNPKIEWATPAAIVYPSKLTPKECNATCKDMEGIFEYFPGTDSLPLPAGEHQITVEFTPMNTKKYNSIEVSVTLIIHKAKPLVKWKDPPPIYNGTSLNTKEQLNAKLVHHPNDLLDNDDGGGGKGRKKRKKAETLDFDENIGNAVQLVDAPDGTFEYYLDPQDPEIELPPEDEAETRLFNDDYYFNKLADEAGVNQKNNIPWNRVESGMKLAVGHHHILCHFIPYDLVNYIRKRVYAYIKVIPKIIPPVVWRAPAQALTYLTPLSDSILNAKVKNVKGSYEFYHCLSTEDIAEPAYQEELRLKAFRRVERANEEEEISLMTFEDAWQQRQDKRHVMVIEENPKHRKDNAETEKEKKKRLKKEKKASQRGVSPSPEPKFTRQSSTGSPTSQLTSGNDDASVHSLRSMDSIDVQKKKKELIDEQPVCDAYLEAIALTKKRAKEGYILPAGTCKMMCLFTPEDRLTYDMGVCFINISIVQAVPEIIWPEELPFSYTTEYLTPAKHLCAKLSDNKDNYGSGSFVYTVTTVRILKSEVDLAEEAGKEEMMRQRLLAIEQEDGDEKQARLEREALLEYVPEPKPLLRQTSALTSSIQSAEYQKPPSGRLVNISEDVADDDMMEAHWHPQGTTGEQINRLPKGHQAITVVYYPQDTRNFTTASASSLITIRCRPEILWDASYNEQLRHGLAVGPEQHCAYVSECDGELTYFPDEGTVLDIGYYTVKVKFVPVDSSLHDITYSSQPLQIIRKIIPHVNWVVKPIKYREPIDKQNICTATCELPGEFTYNIKLGDVLDAGSYSITATFIPEDGITYAVSTSVNQLVILPIQVEIAFQPDDPVLDLTLTYGEPLTDKQFCAHVTFPSEDVVPSMFGEMSYSFAEGDYLPTGTNKMTATFTPLPPHNVNYNRASTFIEIEMIKFIPRLQWDPPQPVIFGTGHLCSSQLDARLVYSHIPPPGTFIPRERIVPGSRASSRAKTDTGTVKGKQAKNREKTQQSAFQQSSPYPSSNQQFGVGGDFNYYASDSVIDSTTHMNSIDNSNNYGKDFNPSAAYFQPGNGPMAQIGFSLSQVSLGIYTDYGASMTENGSTVLGGDGMASHFNEGSVLSMGNINQQMGRSPSLSPLLPLLADANPDFDVSQTIHDEFEREEEVSEAPGGVEDGSLTVDGTYFTAFTSSLVRESVEENADETVRRLSKGDATVSQSESLIDPSISSAPVRLKIADNSELEAYSTKPVTHIMPNMPFDPALETYVVGRQIRMNRNNNVLGKEKEEPIPISGTIRYMPDVGYVFPHAGVFVLRALFLPDDELNIAPTEISVEITVLKARPTVRWAEPQPMFSETPVGPLQLNASVHCPGLKDGIDGGLEYYPSRGEVLPVGLHVLRVRYVPFQRVQHNYDCTNSWAEVPLLVKPKPFNKEYLDNLAPRESTTAGGKRKKKAPKDSWVAGMAWPDPKEVISQSQKRKKRPATTAGNSDRKRDAEGARLMIADSTPNQESEDYKVSDEWHISPRTKDDLQALSTNINAAAQARELLSLHSHRARTSASHSNSPINPNGSEFKAYMWPLTSPDAIVSNFARFPVIASPQGTTLRSNIPSGDDLIDSAYTVVDDAADDDAYRWHDIDQEESQFEGSNFSTSFHNSNVLYDNGDGDFERVGTAASPIRTTSSVQFEDAYQSGTSEVVVDAFERPIYRLDSDNNKAEWLASYSGDRVDYPEDTTYQQMGKKLNFMGGIPTDASQMPRAVTAPKGSAIKSGNNAYLLEGIDTNRYHEGKLTDSSKIFRTLPPETLSHKPRTQKSSPVRAQTAQVNPSMHFGTGDSGKHTTQTIDDLMAKSGKKGGDTLKPFEWNMFVDKRKFEANPYATDVQKPASAKVPLRDKMDEHTARRKLVRLERQINALRRDAYGIAKMVSHVEKLRAKTAGSGVRADKPKYGEDSGEMRGLINPYTGEYVLDDDESTMHSEADDVGIRGDPQGLNRIPGIGTGAAKRVVTSYEMEHPYVDVAVHARNKVEPTPEALLYTTGQWAGGFKETYAVSTSASDRMTDRVGKDRKKAAKMSLQRLVRPSSTDNTYSQKPATAPIPVALTRQTTTRDPDTGTNSFANSSMSIAERALRDSAPPQIPANFHGLDNSAKRPKTGSGVGSAVNVVRTTRQEKA